MNRKNKFLIFLGFILALTLLTTIAAAAPDKDTGAIGNVLGTVGKLEVVYAKFGVIIDLFIYLIIFLGLTQVSLAKLWQGRDQKGVKAVTVGLSIALSVGLALFEIQAGFNIKSFGPIAALILLTLLGYCIWVGVKSLNQDVDNTTLFAFAFIVIYFTLQSATPNLVIWLNENVPIVGGILALISLVCIVFVFYKLIMWIMTLFGGSKERGVAALDEDLHRRGAPAPVNGPQGQPGKPRAHVQAKAVESNLIKIRNHLNKLTQAKLPKDASEIDKYFNEIEGIVKEIKEQLRYARRDARIVAHNPQFHDADRQKFREFWTHIDVLRNSAESIHNHIKNKKLKQVENEVNDIIRELAPVLNDVMNFK